MRWRDDQALTARALAGAVAPLLASLLLIAAVIAPAHCLARFSTPAAALCLAEEDAPAQDQGHHAGGACLACAALAQIAPAPPDEARAPARRIEPTLFASFAHPAPATAPRPAGQPRAPPAA